MYGHATYGSNKYGGLVQVSDIIVTVISKIPTVLTTASVDKNIVQLDSVDKHILNTKNNNTITRPPHSGTRTIFKSITLLLSLVYVESISLLLNFLIIFFSKRLSV